MRLSQSALDGITTDEVVNLLSNNVRYDSVSTFVNFIWTAPLLLLSIALLLSIEFGCHALIGVLVVLIALPIHSKRVFL